MISIFGIMVATIKNEPDLWMFNIKNGYDRAFNKRDVFE